MYAVLFDLDDTLYPERSYVESGFRAVAQTLAATAEQQDALVQHMFELFIENTVGVFDRLLGRVSDADGAGRTPRTVQELVEVYRRHAPKIQLYEDVIPTLKELRRQGIRLGIITDGRAEGQQAKLDALGLAEAVDVVVLTDALGPGRMYWKPHPRGFEIALSKLGVVPRRSVYVGDNPTKDFQAPAQLGMKTVRIHRHDALNLFARNAEGIGAQHDAEYVIESLEQLIPLLRQWSWIN